jgi:hypothetical protein
VHQEWPLLRLRWPLLVRAGDGAQAVFNVLLQVILGLGAVYGGLVFIERLGYVVR